MAHGAEKHSALYRLVASASPPSPYKTYNVGGKLCVYIPPEDRAKPQEEVIIELLAIVNGYKEKYLEKVGTLKKEIAEAQEKAKRLTEALVQKEQALLNAAGRENHLRQKDEVSKAVIAQLKGHLKQQIDDSVKMIAQLRAEYEAKISAEKAKAAEALSLAESLNLDKKRLSSELLQQRKHVTKTEEEKARLQATVSALNEELAAYRSLAAATVLFNPDLVKNLLDHGLRSPLP